MEHTMSSYNQYWLIFSILLSILFSFISMDLRWKMIVYQDIKYKLWLLACAISMGIGIWTMHFVGMAAMEMHDPIYYNSKIVLLSMLVSIVGTGSAFLIMKTDKKRLFLSSVLMGLGIVCMHYLGIEAMKVSFTISYDPLSKILSTSVAIIASYGALWLLFFFNHGREISVKLKLVSGVLMGLGISGTHYIGMWGTHYTPKAGIDTGQFFTLSSQTLTAYISIPVIIVVIIMLISGTVLDKKLIAQIKNLQDSEKKLREADKLSLVGELAAGVAHEIRNPLTSLKGFTEILHRESKETDHHKYLKIMIDEIERINFIVSEFMVLSKPHLVQYTKTNITDIIQHVVTLLNTQAILKNIEIIPVLVGEDFIIECEENQVKQVLVNIIKNSIESIQDGGTVSVKIISKDNNITIEVVDNGVGIPKETLSLLGKPFYTTKTDGTGLGIMVSKKIIQNHNGTLTIKSEEGKGTSVIITLPSTKIDNNDIHTAAENE
ncbi:hypothetical protein FZW96_15665 [Bacillus sp. BGMRC 2118]|nr:hypothetical protein FZW96_15665 [Bacillus sp. BGMRC 2118]